MFRSRSYQCRHFLSWLKALSPSSRQNIWLRTSADVGEALAHCIAVQDERNGAERKADFMRGNRANKIDKPRASWIVCSVFLLIPKERKLIKTHEKHPVSGMAISLNRGVYCLTEGSFSKTHWEEPAPGENGFLMGSIGGCAVSI